VSRINGQRRQNGEDLDLKIVIESLHLFLIQFIEPVKEYPCLFEPRQDHLRDALVLFGNEAAHFLSDFVKLLTDRPAACIDAIDVCVQDAEEPPTRTMKYSSRFELKMEMNFSFSREG